MGTRTEQRGVHHVGEMICKEFVDIVTEYLEGSLSFADRVRVRLHLELCCGCRRYLDQMQHTAKMLRQLPRTPAPRAVKAALIQRLQTVNRRA
jgi:predicted anti-sigma-YlaC factor YlaD